MRLTCTTETTHRIAKTYALTVIASAKAAVNGKNCCRRNDPYFVDARNWSSPLGGVPPISEWEMQLLLNCYDGGLSPLLVWGMDSDAGVSAALGVGNALLTLG